MFRVVLSSCRDLFPFDADMFYYNNEWGVGGGLEADRVGVGRCWNDAGW
jgi:hypothetical protein